MAFRSHAEAVELSAARVAEHAETVKDVQMFAHLQAVLGELATLQRRAVPRPSSGTDVDLTTWSSGVFLVSGAVAAVAVWDLDVWVPGEPVTKGSTRAFAMPANNKRGMRAVTVPDNRDSQRAWSSHVTDVVARAWTEPDPIDGTVCRAPTTHPVVVCTDYVMPRRKSAPKSYTPWHTRKPDGDKLERAVWDALTSVVHADDAQVVAWSGTKREAEIGEAPGARIRVAVLDPRGRS